MFLVAAKQVTGPTALWVHNGILRKTFFFLYKQNNSIKEWGLRKAESHYPSFYYFSFLLRTILGLTKMALEFCLRT